jgi:ABC-type transport system involved in multi-copper enzyme maturation permease subunit
MTLRQIYAILLDSLRFLRSQWLFWGALFFSMLIAIALFGTIRFTPEGWGVLWLSVHESEILTERSFGARSLMSWLFGGAFVYWWLAWGAIIVGLVSTASIIPSLVSKGSIDLLDSKPISRVTLLMAKIGGALLFMLVQVTLGVLAAYVLLGLRYDMWFHSALWAIPLLTIQFLYLYAIMVLLGIITRSALASLLVVMVFWAVISLFQFVGSQLDSAVAQIQATTERTQTRIADARAMADAEERELYPIERTRIERWQGEADANRSTLDTLEPWQKRIQTALLFVPKTADVQRIIADRVEAPTFSELIWILQGMDEEAFARMAGIDDPDMAGDVHETAIAGERAVRDVRTWRSIGSSLGFVFVILLIATFIFRRRDF